jgi:hypothetical protein
MAAVTAALASACDSGAKKTQAPPPSHATTTIRVGGDGKTADIQTGFLTSNTTYIWEIDIGGGKILRCVRNFNGDGVVTRDDCEKVRSR